MNTLKKISLIFVIIFFSQQYISAQYILNDNERMDSVRVANAQIVGGRIENGDTLLFVNIREIIIMPPYKFKNKREKRRYNRLAYNVKKVYPYACMINQTYSEIDDNLGSYETKREQKKYLKSKEKELREEFEKDLINLTFSQGRLLIKLVDRETGNTTYEVLKEWKGGMSAFFWQSIAVVFGANLKSDYNATEEDKMIEDIIIRIENGQF